jgi:aminoglycoside 3-N-acetyltransferase
MGVTADEIARGIAALHLDGAAVCVHASLRSFGHVEGGADAVVDAFLGSGCTVLVPAFSYACIAAPPAAGPARNGLDYGAPPPAGDETFVGSATPVATEMGAVAAAVGRRRAAIRGAHPICSFAAVGPHARGIVSTQTLDDVFAPLRAVAGLGGSALLIGVDLTSLTLLHLAEQLAGRELFVRWGRSADGIVAARVGGCSAGFGAFAAALAPACRETLVGASRWRAYDASAALRRAAAAIRANGEITRCGRSGCTRCPDAIAGGPRPAEGPVR